MSADLEGKVHVKMRASVGALRSQALYWLDPDRAARLISKRFAELVEPPPAPVDVVDAIEQTAELMRKRHTLEVHDDGEKSDQSAGKARTRRRPSNGNGGSDQAGGHNQPDDGKQG